VDLCRRLPGRGQGCPGSGDGRSSAGSGRRPRAGGGRCPAHRCGSYRGGGIRIDGWPDLVVPRSPCHHSLPNSVMGVGVGDLVEGSVDWGGHFFRRRWSVGLGWLESWWITIHLLSSLRVGEALFLVKTEPIGGQWRRSLSLLC
jgi:hypothetical protein